MNWYECLSDDTLNPWFIKSLPAEDEDRMAHILAIAIEIWIKEHL